MQIYFTVIVLFKLILSTPKPSPSYGSTAFRLSQFIEHTGDWLHLLAPLTVYRLIQHRISISVCYDIRSALHESLTGNALGIVRCLIA